MDYLDISTRMLVVLIASTVGLIGGSLVHYVFLEDTLLRRGSSRSIGWGSFLFLCSVLAFLLSVYLLYLNVLNPAVVALAGMFAAKLNWNIGDSLRYAGRLHQIVEGLNGDLSAIKKFLREVRTFRQVQDLRSVARTRFLSGSPQLRLSLIHI